MSTKRFIFGTVVMFIAVIAFAGYSVYKTPGAIPDMPIPSQDVSAQSAQVVPLEQSPSTSPSSQVSSTAMHTITLGTNVGDITFETYDAQTPKTVQNFIALAEKGFYNNLTFHRVIEGFMIQGGDPNGDGTGGPGYKFNDELTLPAERQKYTRGTVAMANAGPNTNGSQFFIMHKDYPLPYNYTIFGKVVSGQDTVDKIAQVKTDPNDRPLTPVVIKSVKVSEK